MDDVAGLKAVVTDLINTAAAHQQLLSEAIAAEKASQIALMALAVALSEKGKLDCRDVSSLMREMSAGLVDDVAETRQAIDDLADQFDNLHNPSDPSPSPRPRRLRLVK